MSAERDGTAPCVAAERTWEEQEGEVDRVLPLRDADGRRGAALQPQGPRRLLRASAQLPRRVPHAHQGRDQQGGPDDQDSQKYAPPRPSAAQTAACRTKTF